MIEEPLMTRLEVAELLSVHPQTVSRYQREGRLSAFGAVGNRPRFRRADVVAFVRQSGASRQVPAPAPALRTRTADNGQRRAAAELLRELGVRVGKGE
jgi:excisionase family DNA binding protein